ncbi:MAG: hypothetical protein KMY55_01760 [Dethiosulfatibacter sp.]|nr:hypothetical protein [Dethiosulfatibacter sp.]
MNLIERYIYAVGQKIWSKNRKDIENELRTILYDNLDEITKGEEATDQQIKDMLKKFGSPGQVASRYNTTEKHLIGPNVYDLYMLVLKIVLSVTFVLTTLGIVTSFVTISQDVNVIGRLLLIFPQYVAALATALGYVTAVFYLIDRFGTSEEIKIDSDWTPDNLPKLVSEQDRVKRVGIIINIILIIFALVIFNFYPNQISVSYTSGDGWVQFSALSEVALKQYLPLWNIVWVLSLIMNSLLLRMGKWSLHTKIFKAVLSVASIIILAMMIKGPDLLSIESLTAAMAQTGQDMTEVLQMLLTLFKTIYVVVIVLIAVELGMDGYKYVKQKH